jgi:hypothetical protein
MNIRNYRNNLLARISGSISANAANLQRLDLARIGRRAEAACQVQDMLADLKYRIAEKAALRAQVAFAADSLELESLAA